MDLPRRAVSSTVAGLFAARARLRPDVVAIEQDRHARTYGELLDACRAHLAGYKMPRAVRFIDFEAFPRSASGKIQRHELERRLDQEAP